jgi:K+-sensing histidine kinase KdpD
VFFDQQACNLIIIRDQTEISKVEYARTLERLSEIMIASTSHDMRTPINTIINMHKLIETKATD